MHKWGEFQNVLLKVRRQCHRQQNGKYRKYQRKLEEGLYNFTLVNYLLIKKRNRIDSAFKLTMSIIKPGSQLNMKIKCHALKFNCAQHLTANGQKLTVYFKELHENFKSTHKNCPFISCEFIPSHLPYIANPLLLLDPSNSTVAVHPP